MAGFLYVGGGFYQPKPTPTTSCGGLSPYLDAFYTTFIEKALAIFHKVWYTAVNNGLFDKSIYERSF